MNLISSLLPVEHVLLDIDVSSKKRLFEHIGLTVENSRHIARAQVFESLFARERLGSTGLGHAVAIPHGRIKSLKDALCIFARPREAVPFDSPDGEPVKLVFSVLVPEHATEQHLQILSELAQMFSDPAMRDALINAPSPAEAHRLLTEWSPYAAPYHSKAA